jgi:SAM-dependent methyltransferase/GNAT superfamily N-acetyltransferase
VSFFAHEMNAAAKPPSPEGFTVRQLLPSEQAAILYGSESPGERLRERFAAGDLCFGALDREGRVVHTRWLTLMGANVPELQMDFVPGPDAAYFYDGYTRPEARRRGIDAVVRAVIFETLQRLGRRRVYSYVRDDNPEGLRAAARCQQLAGTVRYARLFGSRPLLFGLSSMPPASLTRRPGSRNPGERADRAEAWHTWFEGWLKEPLARRSIGFHELPEDAFKAMAGHISETLQLDPTRDLVLDVGCDSALVTRHVAKRCAGLVGVDFIPGMLIDAKRARGLEASPRHTPHFAAADGRALPFPSGTFAKAYCSGVVHTLPSHADGLAMILEMVRILEPGGRALVAAVPDLRKRAAARREAFRLGGLRERAHIVASMLLPPSARNLARRLLPGLIRPALRYLDYDLNEVRALLASRGLECTLIEYPKDFWSRDFRCTRSNLLITVPRG